MPRFFRVLSTCEFPGFCGLRLVPVPHDALDSKIRCTITRNCRKLPCFIIYISKVAFVRLVQRLIHIVITFWVTLCNHRSTYIKCVCVFFPSFSCICCRSWQISIHIQYPYTMETAVFNWAVVHWRNSAFERDDISSDSPDVDGAAALQLPGPKPRVWITYGSCVFSSRGCGLSARRTHRRDVHRPPSFICGASPIRRPRLSVRPIPTPLRFQTQRQR